MKTEEMESASYLRIHFNQSYHRYENIPFNF